MRNNDKATCSSCRYFDDAVNYCRRYAPTPVRYVRLRGGTSLKIVERSWPGVGEMDWCGEWESLEED